MLTIDEQIDIIIEQRSQVAERINKVKTHLSYMYSILNGLEEKKSQLRIDDQDIVTRLNALNFPQIQRLIMNQIAVLDKMQTRFYRENLSIAVVARAKQGKSRLLRSATGLSPNEIPDGDDGDLTGIASSIYPNRQNNETYGMVWFHTPTSFLTEIIKPYYDKLQLVGKVPATILEFQQPLPPLPKNLANNTNTIYQEMYRYLQRYHTHLGQYEHLLGRTSPEKVKRSDIRKYVAQYDENGTPTFDYMAVQQCNIFSPFPNAPTDKIAVVDTQGLGDRGVGDEERLIKLLGENVDLILFIRMPSSMAATWDILDINLYSVANGALANHLPLKKWSFLVLNRTNDPLRGDNSKQCDVLRNQIPYTMEVIDIITANCADPNEVKTKILEPVVNESVRRIPQLDREYAESYQQELDNLRGQIDAELQKARNAFSVRQGGTEGDKYRLFRKKFEEFWSQLTNELTTLINNLNSVQNNDDFEQQIKEVLEKAKTDNSVILSPSQIEEIEAKINGEGKGADAVYSDYLNIAKTSLINRFSALDDQSNRAIEQAKAEVAKLFVEKLPGFSNLTPERGANFIKAMADLLPDQNQIFEDKNNQLKQAFQNLAQSQLSLQGLILPTIEENTNILRNFPKYKPLDVNQNDPEKKQTKDAAEQIMNNTNGLYLYAIEQCNNALISKGKLQSILEQGGRAAKTLVNNFKKQVIIAENVRIEWDIFLYDNQAKIWEKEFGKGDALAQLQKEWEDLIQNAIQSNSLDKFQFIN